MFENSHQSYLREVTGEITFGNLTSIIISSPLGETLNHSLN
jgi:hypothetical protein